MAGDFADPNGDGIINPFADAFVIEPLGPTSGGLPVVTLTGGYLQVSFTPPQGATDLTCQMEVSGKLILWLPGSKYSASWDIASTAKTTQISRTFVEVNELMTLRDNIPAGSGSRYIRVRVTRPLENARADGEGLLGMRSAYRKGSGCKIRQANSTPCTPTYPGIARQPATSFR